MGRAALIVAPALEAKAKAVRKMAALTVMVLLEGCAPGSPTKAIQDVQPTPVSVPADAASCRLAGGVMKPVGRLQSLQCILTYSDAGKSCTSGTQCAGECRAEPGVDARPGQAVAGYCQATSDRFGCSTEVENGRAQATICID